jgi:hypothetical protein
MGTENSSAETRDRAATLAGKVSGNGRVELQSLSIPIQIGSYHVNLNMDLIVSGSYCASI